MVKRTFLITLSAFFLNLTSTIFLFAGEFTANVRNTQLHVNENFLLNLTLKGTSPTEAPAVSILNKDFLIHSQQHLTNTTIINGSVSSSITWKVTLTPKAEGVIEIPAITIDTAEGQLTTQPITLNISSASQSNVDSNGLNILTKVSNASPYKNEPLVYTALLTSKRPLYNVQIQKIQMEDAIVELLKEPQLEERIIDGIRLNVIEFSYLITPLKVGSLTIQPIATQGAIPQNKNDTSSAFDDDFNPFGIMQGFQRLKPFTLMTEEVQLDVLPIIPEISPWLPAKALTLEEVWPSDETMRVGEPFSRSFIIKAEGLKASQLPNLENLQSQNSIFKIYADKPEEQEKILADGIQSMRKEQYTLIPQKAGAWVLPEISISWWDSANREARTSIVPAREVQVLPASGTAAYTTPEAITSTSTVTEVPETSVSSYHPPLLLYGIIGTLSFSLAAALLWAFTLQRKIANLTAGHPQKPLNQPTASPKKSVSEPVKAIQKEKKDKLPDLNPT